MGAPTEYYVDPAIAADSGTGTIGDPYGDLQFALNSVTRDVTNGDRVNIQAGTDEILAAQLTLAAYGTPAIGAPLIFQGYTTAADDGGIGGISGGGSYGMIATSNYPSVHFVDMHLHNCGSAIIVDGGDGCVIENCEIDNSTGHGIYLNTSAVISRNYIHNCGLYGLRVRGYASINFNYFKNETNKFLTAIICDISGDRSVYVANNILDIDAGTDGITCTCHNANIENNSIYAPSGTGTGISIGSSPTSSVKNNVIEGFNGTGGVGIDLSATGSTLYVHGGNSVYNAATIELPIDNKIIVKYAPTEALVASPFTDAANGDFTPVDVGSLKEGSVPTSWKGL